MTLVNAHTYVRDEYQRHEGVTRVRYFTFHAGVIQAAITSADYPEWHPPVPSLGIPESVCVAWSDAAAVDAVLLANGFTEAFSFEELTGHVWEIPTPRWVDKIRRWWR